MQNTFSEIKTNNVFNKNGRITIEPFRTDRETEGKDSYVINYYKIEAGFLYSIQAFLQKKIYTKYPHPNDKPIESIGKCHSEAIRNLENFCNENRLKKCWKRIKPSIFEVGLFDEL